MIRMPFKISDCLESDLYECSLIRATTSASRLLTPLGNLPILFPVGITAACLPRILLILRLLKELPQLQILRILVILGTPTDSYGLLRISYYSNAFAHI
jgi:hypothetical protein